MASIETRPRLGRRLTRRRRQPGRISMDLPERFRYDDENDGQEEEKDTASIPAMHKSIFGVIAAAQSNPNFNARGQASGSESEDEGDIGGDAEADTQTTEAGPKEEVPPSSTVVKHRKRLSETKLLRSLPGLRSKSTKDKLRKPLAVGTAPPASPSSPKPPQSPVPEEDEGIRRDAPIMSQMLQARAKADVESSQSTLTAPKSRAESPASGTAPRKAPVALPDALKDIFQLDEPEEVIAEYPCWYLQSVLLQGYMYITQRHICFYAYLQKKSNTVIKSGHLSKRGKTNPRYHRYWFVLKGDVISYYADAANPYFPSGNIDLRYGISAEVTKDKDKGKDSAYFSVTTDKRTYHFKADSVQSAKEWVKQLQKVIFRSHNDGDSVKISLPVDNIVDVEENPVIDFAETIKIRVIDNDETYAVDEYFFSFFSFGKDALDVLKIMTQGTNAQKEMAGSAATPSPSRRPSTSIRRGPISPLDAAASPVTENVRATLSPHSASGMASPRVSGELSRSSFDMNRRSIDRGRASFDKPHRSVSAASRVSFSRTRRADQSPRLPAEGESSESMATSSEQVQKSGTVESLDTTDASASQILSGSSVFSEPTLRRPQPHTATSGQSINQRRRESQDTTRSQSRERIRVHPPSRSHTEQSLPPHQDPPRRPTRHVLPDNPGQRSQYSESSGLGGLMRAGGIPFRASSTFADYLKNSGKRVSNLFGTTPMGYYEKVTGMIAGNTMHYSEADAMMGDDHVHDPEDDIDGLEAGRRFRDYFALPDSEKLEAAYFGSLQRVLPLYGKIYIGSRSFCFRSLLPGTRTKLVLPFRDILNVNKEKSFRLGRPGMVIVIRGHEEIFFEFKSAETRDDCTVTVLRALDRTKCAQESVTVSAEEKEDAEAAAAENLLLQEARKDGYAEHEMNLPRNINTTEHDAPTILFDDPAASLLDFKPQESLRITCLTIGSRGDVQPYIALCKGLLAEGHKPRIATHAEFEPWIRKHGIDFAPVDGDPAELMRICVENGMFTPSFLYEANSLFRGFLQNLLDTAWEACQDTDLLIESPSAMAGIHIAEALQIPYFRAFTMPWTRTRAYPHAFAVPNHKMGGAYNYMTYVLFDNIFWQSTATQVNRWRRKTLGLRQTQLDKLQPNKVPFLYNFSPSVVVPPLDFSDWIRVTGYWFLDEATDWTPPPDLLAFIRKARQDNVPLVYIGFGSIVVTNSKQLTQNVVDAVLKADVRCILSKGWSDRLDQKGANLVEVPLPPSMFQISSAPHDWLFKQIDAAVHHGGAGTTGASLRAGVPTIIKPFFGDQYFFGSRVEDLGVGIHIKRVTENTLGRALWIACHDERMKGKARVLGEQIRSEDGVGTAIKAIYRDLEYAKTLIKKRELPTSAAEADAEEQNVEESWTFVDNESDAEVASPTMHSSTTWESMHSPGGSRRTSGMALGGQALKGGK